MRTKLLIAAAAVFLFALSLWTPREASAVPAFSRQTGMACNSCHFQHFPNLNAFGRAFKSGGYTQVGGQSLIEGDLLSLPSAFNTSFVTKIRYQKRDGDSETGDAGELNKGQLDFPDEAAFLFGGRVGEHIGFLFEASVRSGDPLFTSFKMPVVFGVAGNNTINVVPYTTDGAGPSYGFELLNTGALRMQRPLEHRTEMSAQQYIGTASGDAAKATGLALAIANPLWFAVYSAWANAHPADTGNSISSGPLLHYFRAAFTPTVAGWDLGVGGQLWAGEEKNLESGVTTRKKAEAWALDAQAQGMIAMFPVGFYVSYARAGESDADMVNIYNGSTDKTKSAFAVTGEVGVIPGKLTAALAYRDGQSGAAGNDTDNATTLGLIYNPTQNLQVHVNHSIFSGEAGSTAASGDNLTTVQLFGAF